MNPILVKTLKTIEEEGDDFNESFDLVDELLNEFGEEGIANRVYSEIEDSTCWETIASLFDIIIWSGNDNGVGLTSETEQWLIEADDALKIQIALNIPVYPFREREKMEAVLKAITTKYPALSARCHELIKSRQKIKE